MTALDTRRSPVTSLQVFCGLLLVAILFRGQLADALAGPGVRTAATVFVAVCVQALPFLVLGVLVSGAVSAFVPASWFQRVLPSRPAAAVPVAGLAGVVLPGCECAAVPVARRLVGQGVPTAAALAFLLAAPAINPIVLVSTAVAFPGQPEMVLARFVGSLATAVIMGWLWTRLGKAEWIAERVRRRVPLPEGRSRWAAFAEIARHDLVEAGGFLVLGGLAAAVLSTAIPSSWSEALAGQLLLAILVMALLAVVLALCSEADAFVVAALSSLPLLPRLVFLVVGPAVDVKLIALQAGTFGRPFAARFAPATFVVAVLCACAAGLLVFGGVR